jgi:hypothetical protein
MHFTYTRRSDRLVLLYMNDLELKVNTRRQRVENVQRILLKEEGERRNQTHKRNGGKTDSAKPGSHEDCNLGRTRICLRICAVAVMTKFPYRWPRRSLSPREVPAGRVRFNGQSHATFYPGGDQEGLSACACNGSCGYLRHRSIRLSGISLCRLI